MRRHHLNTAFVLVLTLGLSQQAFGLAEERIGPQPKAFPQPGWPDGVVTLAQAPPRVYSIWVNGNETFYYSAKPQQITELVAQFSKTHLRDHVVQVTAGEPEVTSFKGQKFSWNVSLNVLGGIALGHSRMHSEEASTFEPVLTVYINSDQEKATLRAFDWPDHLIIRNDIPDFALPENSKQPKRQRMHAAVNFDDGQPAADFEHGMSTHVTMWEKSQPLGFDLGNVSYKGQFQVSLSPAEIARLEKGELWFTMTVGNQMVKPKPDDPRLKIGAFRGNPKSVKAMMVSRPRFYHGQILFDDGSPPILKPLPWPGAAIQISLPYAGSSRPDAEGRFKVTLTAKQFTALKARKPQKNIYVPLYEEPNSSRALHVFPVENLALDAATVKAFRIPRPTPPDSTE